MSEQDSEQRDDRSDDGPLNVPDEDLPEDLRPTEENPLAQPAGDDVPEDLLQDTAGTSSRSSEDAGKGETTMTRRPGRRPPSTATTSPATPTDSSGSGAPHGARRDAS